MDPRGLPLEANGMPVSDWLRPLGDIMGVGKPDENRELLWTDPAGLCLSGGEVASWSLGKASGVLVTTLALVTGPVTASRTEPRGLALGDEWARSVGCSSAVVWTVEGTCSVSSVEAWSGVACGEVYGGTTLVCSPSVNGLSVIGGGLSCLRASSSKGLITESSLAPASLGTLWILMTVQNLINNSLKNTKEINVSK